MTTLATSVTEVLRVNRLVGFDGTMNRCAEVLIVARFERQRLDGVQWEATESVLIPNDISSEPQLKQGGAAKTLSPLPLECGLELQALLHAIDYEELVA